MILNGSAAKAWEWLRLFLGALVIPWCIWMSITIVDIQTRVAVIESNRFSSADGLEVWKELNKKADSDEVPPKWFLSEFQRLRDDFEDHKERTD